MGEDVCEDVLDRMALPLAIALRVAAKEAPGVNWPGVDSNLPH
jgi:hypothetical protein